MFLYSFILSFSDTLYGWIVGSNKTALRTTNGGISWDSVFLETGPYASYSDLRCVASPDPNTVWITNWSGDGYTNLMRSIDGGDTWSKVLSTFTGHIGAAFLDKVSAIDSMKAWVVGYDGLDTLRPDGPQYKGKALAKHCRWRHLLTKLICQYRDPLQPE